MSWRGSQIESRSRHLTHYGIEEVDRYESWVSKLGDEDDEACLSDLRPEFEFRGGMSVLDVGAGTGAMSKVLYRVAGLSITALEPSPHMIAKLRAKPELRNVRVVCGFSDSHADLPLFDTLSFDAIVSRQLLNGLFDPLTAFRNWNQWLKPNGTLIVIDGLYDRPDWTGELKCELGVLPFSACRTMAMAPYLLETVGFDVSVVKLMKATNAMPLTRTTRYVVIARKHA